MHITVKQFKVKDIICAWWSKIKNCGKNKTKYLELNSEKFSKGDGTLFPEI